MSRVAWIFSTAYAATAVAIAAWILGAQAKHLPAPQPDRLQLTTADVLLSERINELDSRVDRMCTAEADNQVQRMKAIGLLVEQIEQLKRQQARRTTVYPDKEPEFIPPQNLPLIPPAE